MRPGGAGWRVECLLFKRKAVMKRIGATLHDGVLIKIKKNQKNKKILILDCRMSGYKTSVRRIVRDVKLDHDVS